MPNYDGGHYFLTAFFPVDLEPCKDSQGVVTSPSSRLRNALATLPNTVQVPRGKPGYDRRSPFARNKRTHLARMVVIDDPAYNGRDPGDAIVQGATGVDLLAAQPQDHLSRPWLMLAADFDAPEGADGALDAWAREIWTEMEPELRAVFRNCVGFDKVQDAAGFAAYLRKGQLETTMSFNDYWIDPPPLPSMSMPALAARALGAFALVGILGWGLSLTGFPAALLGGLVAVAAGVAAARRKAACGTISLAQALRVLGGVAALVGGLEYAVWAVLASLPQTAGWAGIGWIAPVGLLGIAAALAAGAHTINKLGSAPFGTAPNSDLRSVLKSLHLQQNFTRFAIDNQGVDAASLHKEFGRFLAELKPSDINGPTQAPGVFRS
ncbi:hypothetical protein [Azospirillum sp. SYSU D00513]|uniref:hypothetical protein n=1 Tax=Azospirillum sp. SYSU D00513 TaxID=2812561 RepID=UPI001A95C054|nr:hypothetical protein [Azospirillum sp. SYSU D00513]